MTEIIAAIGIGNANLSGALGRGDAEGMADCYTDEGTLLPPGAAPVMGKEGIAAFWATVMEMGVASAQLETVELESHGETAIEMGRYTLGTADGDVADEGKYVVVWKNEGGTWKLHRDIWNTSRG